MHEAMRTEYDGRYSLFECLRCRFRATLDHTNGAYKLLDRGDASVRHAGGTAGVELGVSLD